jgi:hypothetical protein
MSWDRRRNAKESGRRCRGLCLYSTYDMIVRQDQIAYRQDSPQQGMRKEIGGELLLLHRNPNHTGRRYTTASGCGLSSAQKR